MVRYRLTRPEDDPRTRSLARLGFDEGPRGVHTSRTMMLAELCVILDVGEIQFSPAWVRSQVVDQNILGKATHSGRVNTSRKLISLYSFDMGTPLFRAFSLLWREAKASRPVLAVLMAACRDAVLRCTIPAVLQAAIGHEVPTTQFHNCLVRSFESKYAITTLRSTARNVSSTWRQSGHIVGNKRAVRSKAMADYHAFAFAVLIAYLRGCRGHEILGSEWVRMLDFEPAELKAVATEAHRQSLVTYRRIGSVVELAPGRTLIAEDTV